MLKLESSTKFRLVIFLYFIISICSKLTSSPLLIDQNHDQYLCDIETFEKNGVNCTNNWCECPYTLKVRIP